MSDRRAPSDSAGRLEPRTGDALRPVKLQRAVGRAEVGFQRRGAATVLEKLFQSGCCKVRFPRTEPGREPEAVLINTAGGLTDGDEVALDIRWGRGTIATVTTQAAERIYRSRDEPARITTNLVVEDDATAFWLPQETILFNEGRLERRINIELARSARLLAVEAIFFGRAAMGETVQSGSVFDAWRLRVDDKLVFADHFKLGGAISDALARPAIANGATALATLLYAGEDAGSHLAAVRAVLGAQTCHAGASCRDNLLICRIVAATGAQMRAAIIAVANQIRFTVLLGPDAAMPEAGLMPRVWSC